MRRRSRRRMDRPGAAASADRDVRSPIGLAPRHPSAAALRGLDVAAEALAHGGEHAVGEAHLLARAEAGIERSRKYRRRPRLLDRRHDGPPPFAGILDVSLEPAELRIPG